MKLSLAWLREFVDLPEKTPEDLGAALTLHTAELEEVVSVLGDDIFDIDNKSLTHRPDLMGHRGFAREFSAIFGGKLTLPEPAVVLPKDGDTLEVRIKTERCRRFCAIRMSGVKIEPSPPESQTRLETLGTRAISNVVDITNLVMLGHGQPMHAFDAAKVEGVIVVRQARMGEKLMALDGEEYELTEEDVVIADEQKVLSIAGIMGGETSGVGEGTTDIIFESANFDPVSVRKTSTRLGLRSESSLRFEKSLDPYQCRGALLSAAEKLLELCPKAVVTSGVADEFPTEPKPLTLTLDPQQVRSRAGIDVSDEDIANHLQSVGFAVKSKGKMLEVGVPSFRNTKDIAIPEDLIEEVVRLHGLDQVPVTLPSLPIVPPQENALRSLEWMVRDALAQQGFSEVYNYSFVDKKDATLTGASAYVQIENPLSSEHTQLRQTLVGGFLRDLEPELRSHGAVSLFELGKVYVPIPKEVLPKETLHLGLFLAQMGGDEDVLFFRAKDALTRLFHAQGLGVSYEAAKDCPAYAHPAKTAQVCAGGKVVGVVGVLHPQCCSVGHSIAAFAEADLEQVLQVIQEGEDKYEKASSFPSVLRDISLVMPQRVPMADLRTAALGASSYLQSMDLFDEFEDEKKLGVGKKNLAFHLQFQAPDHTLEDAEIQKHETQVIAALAKTCGAELRVVD